MPHLVAQQHLQPVLADRRERAGALSFLYLMARRLAGMLLGSLRSEHAKDVEIAVMRHQLSQGVRDAPYAGPMGGLKGELDGHDR